MAVGNWTFIKHFKKNLGAAAVNLSTAQLRMALFTSAGLFSAAYAHSTYNSAVTVGGELATANNYSAGGGTRGKCSATWLSGTSAGQWRLNYVTARIWTAGSQTSAGGIKNIKFATLYISGANSAAKKLICFSQLSTSPFTVTTGNTLTITASGTGVFNLA